MIEICEGALSGPGEAHDLLARELAFPEWYGRNLSALADCLGDLSGPVRLALVQGEGARWFHRLARVVFRAARENPNVQAALVFAGTGPTARHGFFGSGRDV